MVKALLAALLLALPLAAGASALTNDDQAYITKVLGYDAEILARLEASPPHAQNVHAAIAQTYEDDEKKKAAVNQALDAFEASEILKPFETRRG